MNLILFYMLVCKHAVADLWLQSRLNGKGEKTDLRSMRLWQHCIDHTILTFVVALLFTGIVPALLIAVFDFVTHFAIDYGKAWLQKRKGVKYGTQRYWKWATFDQIAHFTVYLIIVLFVFH